LIGAMQVSGYMPSAKRSSVLRKKNLGFCYNGNDRHQSPILYAISVVYLQLSHYFLDQVNHGASEVVHCTCANMQRQLTQPVIQSI